MAIRLPVRGMSDVSEILEAIKEGDPRAAEQLLPAVYDELRRLAASKLARERPQTLQATDLVHEAYLRVAGRAGDGTGEHWDSRGHFFAAAAEAMRRLLIERARKRGRLRHGGGKRRVELRDEDLAIDAPPVELLALDDALDRLAEEDAVKAELVKLRYFAGLTIEEAASMLAISRATADRYWEYARAWLFHELSKGDTRVEPGGGDAT